MIVSFLLPDNMGDYTERFSNIELALHSWDKFHLTITCDSFLARGLPSSAQRVGNKSKTGLRRQWWSGLRVPAIT